MFLRLLPPTPLRTARPFESPPWTSKRRSRPRLEALEARVVLYSASGNAWPAPQLITLSFMPDGTNLGGPASNLVSTFNSKPALNQAGNDWKTIIERAAQTWAAQTNINFAVVTDNGAPLGSAGNQQGDPNYGDIRIGGYNFNSSTLAKAFMPPPVNNYSIAGDIEFNTGQSFNVGSTYDLYTVAVHEIGHALGLYHSGVASAEEYSSYNGVKTALSSDDVSGIQSIYGGARKPDQYDAAASNDSVLTPTDVTALISPSTLTTVLNADITTTADLDYYIFTVPSGTSGTAKVTATSEGLSLLSPSLKFIDSDKKTVLATASGANQHGTSVTVSVPGMVAGKKYYLVMDGADSTVFGTGQYALTLNLGSGPDPTVPLPNTAKAAGSPLSSGGGQAVTANAEALVNTTVAGKQANWMYAGRYTAMDANGNYVIAWQSTGQDGDGQGVYAQRFDVNGNKVGGEFRVNATTKSDQTTPSVAMDANGDFVIVWASLSQDAANSQGVYAQRYNNQGVAQGGEFRVNTTVAGDQQYPGVAMDQLGNFTVTWTSSGQDGSGQGVYAQRYTSLGLPLGLETRVNTTTAGDQMISRIGTDFLGDAVITWTSAGQDGSGLGVYGQRFDPTGLKVGGEFRVNTTTAGDQTYSSVALDAAGDFTVAWQSFGQDGGGWGVYAQRYNALGAPQGGEFRVNTTTAGDQAFPTVSMDNGGDALISWSSNPTASTSSATFPVVTTYWNSFGGQYTANGQSLGGEFQLNSTTGSDQKYSSLAMDSQGHVVVAWSGGNARDTNGVLAQQYSISFSGDSADGFYAQGDASDPDQAPAAAPTPTTPPPSGGERQDHGPVVLSPGRVDHVLGGWVGLFSTAGSPRTHQGPGTWSADHRSGHRTKGVLTGVGTPKPGHPSPTAHPNPLRASGRHARVNRHPG